MQLQPKKLSNALRRAFKLKNNRKLLPCYVYSHECCSINALFRFNALSPNPMCWSHQMQMNYSTKQDFPGLKCNCLLFCCYFKIDGIKWYRCRCAYIQNDVNLLVKSIVIICSDFTVFYFILFV